MVIGILALQGAFAEHGSMLTRLGAEHFQIRQKKDLDREFDGLILPGGESTVMGKLLKDLDLFTDIRRKILGGMPVFGTCAGLILLAKEVEGGQESLATMSIRARRNAYGRQLGSFHTEDTFQGIGKIPMTFIRAPYIEAVYANTEVLATVNGKIVAARENNILVTAFHPELNRDLSVHRYFMEMIKECGTIHL